MNVLWIFLAIIVFCIYVLFGLHVTEGLETTVQKVLGWAVYTIIWVVFLNVFILGFFWSVIRTKTGPYGLRGPEGETGTIGVKGECSITASQAYCMQQQTQYINSLYKELTNTNILNEETQKFPCTYLNEKIQKIAGSRQYQIIIANLSNDNKGIDSIVNYLKSIWKQWFDLLYNATSNPGVWFTDEFGDENYEWLGGKNPFDEIKKYDVYYWGVTRDFRPLKAEICRSPLSTPDSKFPRPQIPRKQLDKQIKRLKVIKTNSYYKTGDTRNNDDNEQGSWWSPNIQKIGDDTYYPVGDIMAMGDDNAKKTGNTTIGDNIEYGSTGTDGPDMKTILISGDIVDPIDYRFSADPHAFWKTAQIKTPICPDGYTSLGDVSTSAHVGGIFNQYKCVPTECVEQSAPGPINERSQLPHPEYAGRIQQWDRWNKWKDWLRVFPAWTRTRYSNINMLNRWTNKELEPDYTNGYNLMRGGEASIPWYKLKKSCLQKVPNRPFAAEPNLPSPQAIREVKPTNDDLGIGWYGHPYKLDPKYSIFSFLHLVPEGMIVNQGTGERFYIIHVEGDDVNIFNLLTYNNNTNKFDGALQVNIRNVPDPNDRLIPNNKNYTDNSDVYLNANNPKIAKDTIKCTPVPGQWLPKCEIVKKGFDVVNIDEPVTDAINYSVTDIPKRIIITKLDKFNKTQQWKIILNREKKLFKLQNLYNYTYLIATQEALEGIIEFSSIDVNNYRNDPPFATLPEDEMHNRTNFSFIPSFGTNLDVVENAR